MTTGNFQHKTAIITGAAIGIGFEIARQLAAAGAHVFLNDIDPEAATIAAEKNKERRRSMYGRSR